MNNEFKKKLELFLKTKNKTYLENISVELNKMIEKYEKQGCSTVYNSDYYKKEDGIETIDKIYMILKRDGFKSYVIGNIIKYVDRYKYKHKELQGQCNDLVKARNYLEFLLEDMKE